MPSDVTYWPASLQRPLLRAAFMADAAALPAWETWKSQVDMDHYPDPGSFRLLPQVCRNLRQHGVDEPLLSKLTGIARQSWFKNQRAFGTLAPHVRSLRDGGVDVVMRGSLALALRCPDAAFPMDPTWSLLVRSDQAVAAIKQLESSGWKAAAPPPNALLPAYVAYRNGQSFEGPDQQQLHLSWEWLPGHPSDGIWLAAETVELHTVAVSLLGPADHLLDVCAEGRPPVAKPLFWRAIDVMLIVQAAHGKVDWARLVSQARRSRLAPWVTETLRYVQDALDAPLPRHILPALQAVSAVTPIETPAGQGSAHGTIRQEVSRLWSSYLECSGRLGVAQRIFYFPKYLQYAWRLERVSQVPRRALAATLYLLR